MVRRGLSEGGESAARRPYDRRYQNCRNRCLLFHQPSWPVSLTTLETPPPAVWFDYYNDLRAQWGDNSGQGIWIRNSSTWRSGLTLKLLPTPNASFADIELQFRSQILNHPNSLPASLVAQGVNWIEGGCFSSGVVTEDHTHQHRKDH